MKKIIPYQLSPAVSEQPHIKSARDICERLRSRGRVAYWVGGAVRDLLLHPNAGPEDIDISTDASFDEMTQFLPNIRAIGRAFGVGLVTVGRFNYEIATFRKESDYADRRHPREVHPGTWEEDAQRRDFTINALYFDPLDNIVIDFHDGFADIQQRTLRCVGDAALRLNEDPLRILRLFRFAANLNFQIESQTHEHARRLASELQYISKERILLEISKLKLQNIDAFATYFNSLQETLLPSISPSQRAHTTELKVDSKNKIPSTVSSFPGTLLAYLFALNDISSFYRFAENHSDWPLAREERAHLEFVCRNAECALVLPQQTEESAWQKFLDAFRWLQRQSQLSTSMTLWLTHWFETKCPSKNLIVALMKDFEKNSGHDKSLCSRTLMEYLEMKIAPTAKPVREKARHILHTAENKRVLGVAQSMIDCGVLLNQLGFSQESLPSFLTSTSEEKLNLLCTTATRWAENHENHLRGRRS